MEGRRAGLVPGVCSYRIANRDVSDVPGSKSVAGRTSLSCLTLSLCNFTPDPSPRAASARPLAVRRLLRQTTEYDLAERCLPVFVSCNTNILYDGHLGETTDRLYIEHERRTALRWCR